MRSSISEIAIRISRALISASSSSSSTQTSRALTWTPSIEQRLHSELTLSQLTPQLVSAVIDPFLLTHQSLALGFFNWAAQQPNFAHDAFSYRSILKSLSNSRYFDSIDRILKQARTQNVVFDSSIYGHVIALYVRNKRTHIAKLVFDEIRTLNLAIGADVYNLVLAGLASQGQVASALKVFDEMLEKGVCFSSLGFGVFVWNFVKDTELDKLLRMVDDVLKGPSSINGSIMAVLVVHGLCRASRSLDASKALDELRTRGWKPDFVSYRVVAESYRETGDVVARERILKKKRKLGVAPRMHEYGEFILSMIAEKLIYESKELGEVLVGGNFPVDDDVLNALVGTVSGMYPSSALEFFNSMIKSGILPTALTLANFSRNLCKNSRTDELLQVYQALDLKGYFRDIGSYDLMISFLCRSGRVKEAYGAMKEMKKKGLNPPVELYNYIMEACCRDDLIRPAKRLWDEMFASGCDGNLKTYSLLIGKLSEIREVKEARRLFHHMSGKGIRPDSTICRSLIEGLCREGQFAAALEVLRCGSCGTSDLESHVRFLECLAEAGELEIAREHIEWVKQTEPSMLGLILTQLAACLSSPSTRERIQQLIAFVQDKCLIP